MTDKKNNLLVEAPKGKGFYLNTQKPYVYVSGRPYSVRNSPQVQLASARNALNILGETKLNDEEFLDAYTKDPSGAVLNSVIKAGDKGKEAIQKSAKRAKAQKAKQAQILKQEEARVAAEKAALEAEQAKLAAEKGAT